MTLGRRHTHMSGIRALFTAVTIFLAACSNGAGTTPTFPSTTLAPHLELTASCGAVVFDDPTRPEPPSTPLDADAQAALDQVLAVVRGEAAFFDEYDWLISERTDTTLVLFGTPRFEPPVDTPPYAVATFVREGDVWQPEGWGQCRIELDAPGFGNATWILDPDVEPHPDTTVLEILINEQDCASGEPPTGRDIVPVVATTMDTITITVLVEPVAGDAACPSNPWHRVTVELGEPLGERTLLDGHTLPPLERPWPPSPSSLDSFGRDG